MTAQIANAYLPSRLIYTIVKPMTPRVGQPSWNPQRASSCRSAFGRSPGSSPSAETAWLVASSIAGARSTYAVAARR